VSYIVSPSREKKGCAALDAGDPCTNTASARHVIRSSMPLGGRTTHALPRHMTSAVLGKMTSSSSPSATTVWPPWKQTKTS